MPPSSRMVVDNRPYFPTLWFKGQFLHSAKYPSKSTDLTNKVAIVTGANQGLGYECARQFLGLHLSHLVLAVRSLSKGEAAAASLKKQYPKVNVEVRVLDMANYDSIQTFVSGLQNLPRIDYVVLNAGMTASSFRTNPTTGHEEIFQVNYLSTVLLAMLLLPVLRTKHGDEKPPVMTLINSGLAIMAKFKQRDASPLIASFDDPKNFDMDRYNTTKLLAHMWLWKLADVVHADDVVVNLADPGYVKGTDLLRDMPSFLKPITWVMGHIAGRSVQTGASTYTDAVVTKGKESHGCLVMDWQVRPFAATCYTPEARATIESLWEETLDELKFANVRQIVEGMSKA